MEEITSKRQLPQAAFDMNKVLPRNGLCIYPKCKKRYTTFHAPYCEHHSPVYIAQSTIEGAGMGLFAKQDLTDYHILCNYCSGAKVYKPSHMRNNPNMTLQNGENTDYTLGIFLDRTVQSAENHELVFDTDPNGVRRNAQPVNIASYANDATQQNRNNLLVGVGSTDDAGTPLGKNDNAGYVGGEELGIYQARKIMPGDFYTTVEVAKDDELFLKYGDAYWDDPNVTPVVLRLTAGPGFIAGSSGSHGSGPSPALVNPPGPGPFTPQRPGPPSPTVTPQPSPAVTREYIDLTGDSDESTTSVEPQAPPWHGGDYNTYVRNYDERLDGRSNIDTNRFTFRNVR